MDGSTNKSANATRTAKEPPLTQAGKRTVMSTSKVNRSCIKISKVGKDGSFSKYEFECQDKYCSFYFEPYCLSINKDLPDGTFIK